MELQRSLIDIARDLEGAIGHSEVVQQVCLLN